jgi:hypothetical protein
MRNETWEALDSQFSETPILKAESVELDEIVAAERRLSVPLVDDYREFIRRYGGAIVGPFPVYGLRKAGPMGNREGSFLEITEAFRQKGWPGVENWVVISMDHGGNPIGLDADGKIWISDHDAGAVQVIAKSFESYLRKQCLNLPD